MGVQARLVFYAPDTTLARQAARAAFDRVAALNTILSHYLRESELSRLNSAAGGLPVPVSPELYQVLERAQHLARLSGGAFDATVGPVVMMWREARRSGRLPDSTLLQDALSRTGWEKLRLDPEHRTATLLVPGMQLDLGGIAKGFAADEALAVLRRQGLTRALVEFGGDIVAGDPPPGETGWRIHVEHADTEHRTLRLANRAVSTSGDAEQFAEIGGARYSHIVDPRTGLGLTDRIAVTVVAPDGFTSDGLATMLSVLGAERGLPIIRTHFPGVQAYVRRTDALD